MLTGAQFERVRHMHIQLIAPVIFTHACLCAFDHPEGEDSMHQLFSHMPVCVHLTIQREKVQEHGTMHITLEYRPCLNFRLALEFLLRIAEHCVTEHLLTPIIRERWSLVFDCFVV
jgi:hypothetical protein